MRTPAVKRNLPAEKLTSFPAPVHGWIANVNLAVPNARAPDGGKLYGAAMLENWIPTATGIRMRGGSNKHATIGAGDADVESLFTYVNGANQFLFAADETGIYEILTPADPDVSPSPEVGSLTSGDWSAVQFATPGGTYLRLFNGADTSLVFDGSTWGTTPAITGVTSANLSHGWSFKNRIFAIQAGTLDAWYLPVDSIGGAMTKFPMGGVFTRGGSLLFGASWSLDTGSGLSEQCAFFTTEGEVAVYQGTDPSSASTWSKVGVYRIGRPRGKKAFIRAGGDLVISTDIGFVPLSQAIQRDLSALAPAAVSYPIEVAWNQAISERSTGSWHCEVWPAKQMVLVVLHNIDGVAPQMFAANARTGAWGLVTGWEGRSICVIGDRCFFGSVDGKVIEAEVGGSDQGTPYTATVVPLFDSLKTPASLKTGLLARAVIRSPKDVDAKLTLQTDYTINLPTAPNDITSVSDNVWGTAIWGQSVWGTPPDKQTYQKWRPVPGSGQALSISTQITSGSVSAPEVDLVQADLTYELGAPVT